MLSVGRGGYGEKRLGFGFERRGKEEEAEELEEGEARYGTAAAGDGGFIDPDVDFSYIDERIQNVLGQFQKDFEGGVIAENLGPKYGGYGSFLPTHQQSPPIRPQTTTPPSASSYKVSRLPCRKLSEVVHQNRSVDTVISVSKNRGDVTAEPPENSGRMDTCTNMLDARDSNLHHGSFNKQASGGGEKTLKVRIKVGGNDVPDGKDAAAIYSGLGLDASPFSSSDESSDCSKVLSPVLRDSPHESPSTILQMMTCFPVEGGQLLSPLPDRLLHLEEKGSWYLKTIQPGILCKDTHDNHAFSGGQTSPRGDVNGHLEKKASSVDKGRIFTSVNNSNLKDCKRTILKRDMNTDAGRDPVSDALSIPVLSSCSKGVDVKAEAGQELVSDALSPPFKVGLKGAKRKMENQLTGESAKLASRMPAISWDSDKVLSRDIISSVESAKKKKFNFTGSSEKGMAPHLGNEKKHMKVKLCAKIGSSEKALEERKTSGPKNVPCDLQREGSDEHEKNYHGARGKRNHSVGSTENVNQKTIRKATAYEHDGEEMLQRKSMLTEVRRKSLGSQVNDLPSSELSKENLKLYLSTSSKEKKIFQTRGDHSEIKSKGLKSRRGSYESLGREFSKEVLGKPKVEVDNGISLPDTHSKYRPTDAKLGNKNPKERPSARSEAVVKEPVLTPLTSIPASDVVAAPNDPVLLDNWVECVRCKIWRFLPYGINPSDLPEDWTCEMQTWLRGMNRCGLSQEETEKAVYALYQVHIPEKGSNLNDHYDAAAFSLATAHHLDQNPEPSMPCNGEKKCGLKDTSNVHDCSTPAEFSDPVKKNQRVSIKSRRLHDAKDVIQELDTFSGASFAQVSKSADSITQKLKVKDESSRHSSEGVKHSKTGIKREAVEDGCRISKKMKTQDSAHSDKDWHSDHDTVVKAVSSQGNICSTKGQYFQKYKNSSYSNDSMSKDYNLAVDKKLKPQVTVNSDVDLKHEFALDIERSGKPDCAAKKRKVKGWEETQATREFLDRSQHHGGVNTIDEFRGCELRKENNNIILKFEGKESNSSKGSDIAAKKARTTRIRLSGSKTQAADGIYECRDAAERDHQVVLQRQANMPPQQAPGSNDYLKRDKSNRRLSQTANSSSSKVSGSGKNKAHFQEARGSPVESASSSPVRILKIEKNAARKNSVGKNDERQKTCLHADVDSPSEQSRIRKKKAALDQASYMESHKAGDSGVQDSFCYQDDVSNHLSSGKAKGKVRLKISGSTQHNLTHSGLQETKLVGGSANIFDQQKVHANNQDKLFEPPGESPVHDQDVVNNQQNTNWCIQQMAGKNSSCVTGRYRSSETGFGKVKLKFPNSFSAQEELHPTMDGSSASRSRVNQSSHCYRTYEEYARDRDCISQEKDEKDNLGSKVTMLGSGAKCLSTGDTQFPSRTPKQCNVLSSRSGLSDASHVMSNPEKNLQQATSHNDGKSSAEHVLHRSNQSEVASGGLKPESLLPSRDKQEVHSQGPKSSHAPQRKRGPEVLFLDSTNVATPNMVEQNKNIDNQNVLVGRHSSLRHPSPDGFDAQRPTKEYNQSIAKVSLKEASDLKHTATRLKDEGREYESAGLYFQAALKLLHVASLWEPSDGDLIKYVEPTKSLRLYVETAKLCELCAGAFERYKQLAAAALAYKCMEVARFKVAYLKHPIAIKDQQELQAALQMVIPGESPLSSVSDVDNLINVGRQEMSTSTKGVSSPQTAGNYVISDRLRPTYTRWFDYTFETMCPFEASKKACNAFAAAIAGLGKENNIMSSVKQVLDINFPSIEELLRLPVVCVKREVKHFDSSFPISLRERIALFKKGLDT